MELANTKNQSHLAQVGINERFTFFLFLVRVSDPFNSTCSHLLKTIIKSNKLVYALVLIPLKLNRMSDCKFHFMRQLQKYTRVMDYTHVRSLGFLNICMLGKQLTLLCIIPPNQKHFKP
jgi:hypothetical protein